MTTIAISINKLDPWPHNVRKTKPSKQADAELLASIRSSGVLENLVVIPGKKDRYQVIAGERRRQALLKLAETGDKNPTDTVDCQVRDPAEALELSLIENTHRAAMHPADEFEAYAALMKDERLTEKNIAERFGVTKKHVQQRLKLAQVHPDIIAAFRAGKISYDAVMGFTTAQSQEEQLTVWKEICDDHFLHEFDGDDIRRQINQDAISADSGKAKFVGIKAYRAAGGTVTEDLFNDAKWLNDVALVEQLALKKLHETTDGLLQAGWKWAQSYLKNPPYNDIHNLPRIKSVTPPELLQEQKKLQEQHDLDESDETEAALNAIENKIQEQSIFHRHDMATAGCIIYFDYQGELVIEKGLIRKSDNATTKQQKNPSQPIAFAEAADDGSLPAKLAEDLREVRHSIARKQILQHPQLASELLIYVICRQALAADYSLPLNIRTTETGSNLPELPEPDLSWINDDDDVSSWQAFRNLSPADVQHLMAHCTARLLTITLAAMPGKDAVMESVLTEMNIDWHQHWQPNFENYFGRLKKDSLLSLGESLFSAEWRAQRVGNKRTDIADDLYEQTNQITGWLPAGIKPE